MYSLHRIIWLYVTSKFPPHEIDHINGIKNDNRWKNLRLATHKENTANRGAQANNTSGYKWVGKFRGKWRARCGDYHLDVFNSRKKAHRVAHKFAKQLHGNFVRFE